MQLIDTHSHLYDEAFDTDRDAAVARAREAGLVRLLLPDIDTASRPRMLALARRYPDLCLPMAGLHPTSINDNPRWREELDQMEELLRNPADLNFCGVGEIGLDFYWSAGFRREQTEALNRQFDIAVARNLPVAIHTRAAWPEMEELVRSYAGRGLRGVFHAFTEDAATYRRLRACGDFLFGIGGVVTFRKSKLADAVREMDLADLVLETDCPYLTPAPYRGRRNESAFLPYVCNKVADLKGLTAEEVASATTANAQRMFLPMGCDRTGRATPDKRMP